MSEPKKIIVAIDGPAGAGKSTAGKTLAVSLKALYIDTGAMYRAIAWKALHQKMLSPSTVSADLTPELEAQLTRIADTTILRLEGDPYHLRVFADGQEITNEIRTPEVSQCSSLVSSVAGVRAALVAQQRAMGAEESVVMDGRDIGTHVFPKADVKFFVEASIETRSQRRFDEERARGQETTLETTRTKVLERDQRDRTRTVSPLRPAEDAIYLDTSDLTPDQVVERMLAIIDGRCGNASPN